MAEELRRSCLGERNCGGNAVAVIGTKPQDNRQDEELHGKEIHDSD